MFRGKQNKRQAARKFKSNGRTTKAVNVAPPPQRGGYRM